MLIRIAFGPSLELSDLLQQQAVVQTTHHKCDVNHFTSAPTPLEDSSRQGHQHLWSPETKQAASPNPPIALVLLSASQQNKHSPLSWAIPAPLPSQDTALASQL